jgi:hypothetical protein
MNMMKRIIFIFGTFFLITTSTHVKSDDGAIFKSKSRAPSKTPISFSPVTFAPVTKAPTTKAPVTKTPTTKTPVTKTPTTKTPVTKTPTTKRPTTKVPLITVVPTKSFQKPSKPSKTNVPTNTNSPTVGILYISPIYHSGGKPRPTIIPTKK